MSKRNTAASVRARLLAKARTDKQDFNFVLTRYAVERLLYRLSVSALADHFFLKGALLFNLWFDIPHRPTRDADLLSFGSAEIRHVEATFREICAVELDDGMRFQADSVHAEEIRKEANYSGVRVTLIGLLDGARCHVQVDVGFGDAVTPGPEAVDYPVMLSEMPAPKLRAYPRYTVIAEKLEALVALGIANSRMKDYFDLWILSRYTDFDGDLLCKAIHATFERRRTPLPDGSLSA
ncbi:MAG: nucleotidyl transferase AbiEii/AbiGii toxin family protein [Ottowia sp.]|nr:nucleotidyl transferase AbiEii/AbiGii toxin family protein [Ottowia sp.]